MPDDAVAHYLKRLREPLAVTLTGRELELIELALETAEDVARWHATGEMSEFLRERLRPDDTGVVRDEIEDIGTLLAKLDLVIERNRRSLDKARKAAEKQARRNPP